MDGNNLSQSLGQFFNRLLPRTQSDITGTETPDASINGDAANSSSSPPVTPASSHGTPAAPPDDVEMNLSHSPDHDNDNDDSSDDGMPALQDISDSSEEEFSDSDDNDSDMDQDEVRAAILNETAGLPLDHPDLADMPALIPIDGSSPPRANRRVRVEGDEDADRDRRHPSQRVGTPSNSNNNAAGTQQPHDPQQGGGPIPAGWRGLPPQNRQNAAGPPNPFRLLHHFGGGRNGQPQPQVVRHPNGVSISFDVGMVPMLANLQGQGPPGGAAGVPGTAGAAPGHANVNGAQPHGPGAGGTPRTMFGGDLNMFSDLIARLGVALTVPPELVMREDPKRAKKLVAGLEEVPVGLVRRLERVGDVGGEDTGGSGGDSCCAICWDNLLDAEGEGFGKDALDKEQKMETDMTSEEAAATESTESTTTTSEPTEEPSDATAIPPSDSDKTLKNPETKPSQPKIVSLPCAHVFHASCLIPWFSRPHQTTCPTCRFNIDPENLTYVPLRPPPRPATANANPNPNPGATGTGAPAAAPAAGDQGRPLVTPITLVEGTDENGMPFARVGNEDESITVTGIAGPGAAPPGQTAAEAAGQPQPRIVGLPNGVQLFSVNGGPPWQVRNGGPNDPANGQQTDPQTPADVLSMIGERMRSELNGAAGTDNGAGNNHENQDGEFTDIGVVGIFEVPEDAADDGQGGVGGQGDGEGTPFDQHAIDQITRAAQQAIGRLFTLAHQNPGQRFGVEVDATEAIQNAAAAADNTSNDNVPAGAGEEEEEDEEMPGLEPVTDPTSTPDVLTDSQPVQDTGAAPRVIVPARLPGRNPGNPDPFVPHPTQEDADTLRELVEPADEEMIDNLTTDQDVAEFQRLLRIRLEEQVERNRAAFAQARSLAATVRGVGTPPLPGDAAAPPTSAPDNNNATNGDPAASGSNTANPAPPIDGLPFPFPGANNATNRPVLPPFATATAQPSPNAAAGGETLFRQLFGGPPVPQQQQQQQPVPGNGAPNNPTGARLTPFPNMGPFVQNIQNMPNLPPMFMGPRPPRTPRVKKPWTLPPPPGPTLRQRIERKEREAGLRCHDISCGIGPSDEDPFVSLSDALLRQLSIHTPNKSAAEEVKNVCEHTFHPSCLISAHRVALRGAGANIVDGQVEVACPVCKSEGLLSQADWDAGVSALA